MYFWKIESLKKDITDGSFGDKELLPYLVIYVGLSALGAALVGYLPIENINMWDYVNSILYVLVPIVGTIYVYRQNGGGNGENFASKYLAIGFVVTIRFIGFLSIISLPIGVVYMFFGVVFDLFGVVPDEEEKNRTTFFGVISSFALHLLFFFRIGKHIGDTVKTNALKYKSSL